METRINYNNKLKQQVRIPMNNGSPKKVSQQCQTPVQNASNPCTTQILSSSQPQLDKSMISTMTSGSPKLLSNT